MRALASTLLLLSAFGHLQVPSDAAPRPDQSSTPPSKDSKKCGTSPNEIYLTKGQRQKLVFWSDESFQASPPVSQSLDESTYHNKEEILESGVDLFLEAVNGGLVGSNQKLVVEKESPEYQHSTSTPGTTQVSQDGAGESTTLPTQKDEVSDADASTTEASIDPKIAPTTVSSETTSEEAEKVTSTVSTIQEENEILSDEPDVETSTKSEATMTAEKAESVAIDGSSTTTASPQDPKETTTSVVKDASETTETQESTEIVASEEDEHTKEESTSTTLSPEAQPSTTTSSAVSEEESSTKITSNEAPHFSTTNSLMDNDASTTVSSPKDESTTIANNEEKIVGNETSDEENLIAYDDEEDEVESPEENSLEVDTRTVVENQGVQMVIKDDFNLAESEETDLVRQGTPSTSTEKSGEEAQTEVNEKIVMPIEGEDDTPMETLRMKGDEPAEEETDVKDTTTEHKMNEETTKAPVFEPIIVDTGIEMTGVELEDTNSLVQYDDEEELSEIVEDVTTLASPTEKPLEESNEKVDEESSHNEESESSKDEEKDDDKEESHEDKKESEEEEKEHKTVEESYEDGKESEDDEKEIKTEEKSHEDEKESEDDEKEVKTEEESHEDEKESEKEDEDDKESDEDNKESDEDEKESDIELKNSKTDKDEKKTHSVKEAKESESESKDKSSENQEKTEEEQEVKEEMTTLASVESDSNEKSEEETTTSIQPVTLHSLITKSGLDEALQKNSEHEITESSQEGYETQDTRLDDDVEEPSQESEINDVASTTIASIDVEGQEVVESETEKVEGQVNEVSQSDLASGTITPELETNDLQQVEEKKSSESVSEQESETTQSPMEKLNEVEGDSSSTEKTATESGEITVHENEIVEADAALTTTHDEPSEVTTTSSSTVEDVTSTEEEVTTMGAQGEGSTTEEGQIVEIKQTSNVNGPLSFENIQYFDDAEDEESEDGVESSNSTVIKDGFEVPLLSGNGTEGIENGNGTSAFPVGDLLNGIYKLVKSYMTPSPLEEMEDSNDTTTTSMPMNIHNTPRDMIDTTTEILLPSTTETLSEEETEATTVKKSDETFLPGEFVRGAPNVEDVELHKEETLVLSEGSRNSVSIPLPDFIKSEPGSTEEEGKNEKIIRAIKKNPEEVEEMLSRKRRDAEEEADSQTEVNCSWNIKTEPDLYLLVTFHNLSAPFTVDCEGAFIEVERENNGFDARWCGNRVLQGGTSPHVIFAKTEVRISVFDDGEEGKNFPTGFSAEVEVIDLFDGEQQQHVKSKAYSNVKKLVG